MITAIKAKIINRMEDEVKDQKFFDTKQGAAVYKHGILSRYLPIFVSKVGSTSKDSIVYYLDGFAGPGIYNDGNEGSPALALSTVETLKNRNLQGICVESNTKAYSELCDLLANYPGWRAINGKIEDCLENLLLDIKGYPLFAFFDPFGLSVPFELLTKVLNTNPPSAPTEMLLNFSLSGLRRNAGHLTTNKNYKSKGIVVERVDKCLGGDWWRDYWRDDSINREEIIAIEYINKLKQAGGGEWGYAVIDIPDRWGGAPSYKLMFLTKHPDGLWLFHESLSLSREDFQQFCSINKTQLFPEDDEWTREISKNILTIFDEKDSFIPKQVFTEIYGNAIGKAREKHVRVAIKELYQQGLIIPNPAGKKLLNTIYKKPN